MRLDSKYTAWLYKENGYANVGDCEDFDDLYWVDVILERKPWVSRIEVIDNEKVELVMEVERDDN